MSYFIDLTIIAFGDSQLLKQITRKELEPKEIIESVRRLENSVMIKCSHKIGAPRTMIDEFFDQLQGLSYFLEVHDDMGYAALYYKNAHQVERPKLFEIMDCISNDFLENYEPSYLKKFESINLNWTHINLLRETSIGTAYTNLLINPNCYK